MNTHSRPMILRPTLALAIGALVLVLAGLVLTGPARAVSPKPGASAPALIQTTQTQGSIVQFGDDVTVAAGQRVDSVVAVGGDVTINGSVKSSVVAVGGDVVVRGTIGNSLVAAGGDVRLAPTAVVGQTMSPGDKSIVLFGGALTRAPGSQVVGNVQRFDNANWTGSLGWGASHVALRPLWWGFSLIGWIVQTAIFLVLGLVAAALMPKQMKAVQRRLAKKPAPSLGWGALTLFIIVPAILVALVISIVGLLLVLPYVVVVALFYFFVVTSVGALIAQRVLSGTEQKDNLMLAVTLGVVGTTVLSRIPVVGGLVILVMAVFGTGAAVMAFFEWRREKRPAATPAAPAGPPVPTAMVPAVAMAGAPVMDATTVTVGQAPPPAATVVAAAAASAAPPLAPTPPAAPAPPAAPPEATAEAAVETDGSTTEAAPIAETPAPEATAATEASAADTTAQTQIAPAGEVESATEVTPAEQAPPEVAGPPADTEAPAGEEPPKT
jgi:hypothetical protein